jgi:hypothetical protein
MAPEPHLLKSAGQPHGGGFVGFLADELLTIECHRPLGRAKDAGDQVEDSSLACAIGANKAGNLARVKAEMVVGHSLQAAEIVTHVGDVKKRHISPPPWVRTPAGH